MKIIKSVKEIKELLWRIKHQGKGIGFVPTMGSLHQGHLSLIQQCKKENDVTVVSIFVNPTQFEPNEDYNDYPRDLENDTRQLENMAIDILFFPDSRELYPADYATYVEVEKLGKVLCGTSRPHHFKGVATIVMKLFNIVKPDRAYFGSKDAQQAIILKKMVKDLNLDVLINVLPIVRDQDGLALSSRNLYLSAREREAALLLPLALQKVKKEILEGLRDSAEVKVKIKKYLDKDPLIKIDYIEVVSLDSLQELNTVAIDNTLAAAAIWLGKTRLIDNFILGEI